MVARRGRFEKQLKNFIVLAEGDRVPFVHNRVEYQIGFNFMLSVHGRDCEMRAGVCD